MIKFYPERTIEEQAERLPQDYRNNYRNTVLDQVEIDGNIIRGYMEYSFLSERSYHEQPTRSLTGAIENINSYTTFLTPRLIIKYNMMNIKDYRTLMTLLQSKNEFTVTCYDPVLDKRVTHKMYAAPTSMPIIYQQYLMALGIQEFSVELIGTNNDDLKAFVTYIYNIPKDVTFPYGIAAHQEFPRNVSGIVGENAIYTYNGTIYKLSSNKTSELMNNKYVFKNWNTKADGSGITYIDGDAYYFNGTVALYAQWG